MSPTTPDLKKAALELAAEGVAVFPVGKDKKPRNENGFHGATTSPPTIKKWDWKGGGIGAAIQEGCFVVDIDPRNSGDKTIKALLSVGHTFPPTKVVKTQSGGFHRYYRLPDDLVGRKLRGTLGPGVDVKASGKGYVLIPPSPGYSLEWDREAATAPQWLLDEILAPEIDNSQAASNGPKFFEQFEKGTPYGRSAMEKEIGRLLMQEEGGRNNALNRAAFALAQLAASGELDEDNARENLQLAGERMGLDAREIGITVESGWNAGMASPREAPPREPSSRAMSKSLKVEMGTHVDGDFLAQAENHFWLDWENADDTPPPFYLFPIIPKKAYVLVYGATEASKSMVLLGLACTGSHAGLKTTVHSLENPSHIDIDRVKRFAPNPENFRISNEMIDLNDPHQFRALVAREQAWETDWLIIDTYSHAFYSSSEDGNAKAIEFARLVRHIMHLVGCSVILVDHTGYADHGEPRDASAKRQQVDVAIKMSRPDSWKWEPGKDSAFVMENHKSARFGNPFQLAGRICDVKPGRGLKLEWNRGQTEPEWRI